MLNRESSDLRNTYRTALASAELLRLGGDPAKAARVESLARMIARELLRRERASERRHGGNEPAGEIAPGELRLPSRALPR